MRLRSSASTRPNGVRRTFQVIAALATGAIAFAVATPAGATTYTSGTSTLWELDGNLDDSPGTAGADFGSLDGIDHVGCPKQGGGDTIHGNNDKLEDDDNSAGGDMDIAVGSPPAKIDFCRMDSTSVVDFSSGTPHVWAVIGWQTVPGQCGTAAGALLFELAKDDDTGPDGWFTDKGTGDLTLWFGYTPASGDPGAQLLSYSGSPTNRYDNIDMNPSLGGVQPLLVANSNSPLMKWAWDNVSCTGEVMVDMTALGLFGSGPGCTSFAGMQAHSQSTDSPSAVTTTSLQDGFLPIPAAISNCPNLAIAKTDGLTSVAPGAANTYTVTVTNNSPATVLNAPVTDIIPAGFNATSWTCAIGPNASTAATDLDDCDAGATGAAGSQTSNSGGTVTSGTPISSISLEPGSAATFTITGAVSRAATGTLTNTATIDDGTDDPGTDDSASDDTSVRKPNISITKTAVDCTTSMPITSVVDGTRVCFDISVRNTDDGTGEPEGPALNLVITDVLPADAGTAWSVEDISSSGGSIFSSATSSSTAGDLACAIAVDTLTCSGAPSGEFDLAVGGVVTVRIATDTTAATIVDGPIVNTATADADNDDPVTGTDNVGFKVANLAIEKSVIECVDGDATSVPPIVDTGENVCFSITVSNVDDPAIDTDGATALGVELVDPLPTDTGLNWTLVSAIGSGVSNPVCTPTSSISTLTCGDATFNLPVGSSFTVIVSSPTTTDTAATSPVSNVATATAANAPEVTADAHATLQGATIEIDKVADEAVVDATATIGYSITVTNLGPATAHDVVMTDSVPIVAGVVWSITAGTPTSTGTAAPTCDLSGGVVTCGGPAYDMPAGASFTVHIDSPTTAASASPIPMVNNAIVDGSNIDPDSDAEPISVRALDLSATKTDFTGTYVAGAPITYQIDIANAGPATATDAVVTDTVPPQITGVTWTCATLVGGSCGTASGSGNDISTLVTLTAGQSVRLTVSGLVDAATTIDPLTNTVVVQPDPAGPPDTNPTNNSATDSDSPNPSDDLHIAKDGPTTATPGGNDIVYTIAVGNNGPSTATNVIVTDPTPQGLVLVSVDGCLSASTFPCELGDLPAGAAGDRVLTATYQIPAGYSAGGNPSPISNVATATSDTSSVSDDHDVVVDDSANVLIEKTGPQSATAGDEVEFVITVTNEGPSDAQSVVVSDVTPEGLTFLSNSGACSTPYPCQLGTLQAGETVAITSSYEVPADYLADGHPNPIVNQATVTSETDPEPPPPAEWQVDVDELLGEITLHKTLVQIDSSGSVVPFAGSAEAGSNVDWAMSIDNAGVIDLAGPIEVVDPLPPELHYLDVLTPGWSCEVSNAGAEVVTCTSESGLAVGETTVVVISTQIDPDATGAIENVAEVSADGIPGDVIANNRSSAFLGLRASQISTTTTAAPTTSAPTSTTLETTTTGSTTTTPSTTQPTTTTTQASSTTVAAQVLGSVQQQTPQARTGSNVVTAMLLGATMMLAGCALLTAIRRRRRKST